MRPGDSSSRPTREPSSVKDPAISQPASPNPAKAAAERLSARRSATARTQTATAMATRSWRSTAGRSPRFQASIEPTGTAMSSGTISGTKVALKKGGPTEIFGPPTVSRMSG